MLYLADKLHKLDFGKLMAVYEEGNRENGAYFWPELSEGQQLLRAEEDFYQYLQEVFFPVEGAVYAVWQENGAYMICNAEVEMAEEYRSAWSRSEMFRCVVKL